jgi:signal transduction histidine kinase
MSTPLSILLIEDDADDVLLAREMLRESGVGEHALAWAPTADEGLAMLSGQTAYDVCLIDYQLGSTDGITFIRDSIGRGIGVPFILLTGMNDPDTDAAALRAGAADFLNKQSITPALLGRSIRYTIQARRTEQQRVQLALEKVARQEAEAANRAKDEFLAVLSHELRTPLNAIMGWTQLLRQANNDPTLVGEAVDTIERNARMQAQLVNDLLDVSRVIAGKIELERRLISLNAVANNAVESVQPTARQRSITVELSLSDEPVDVNGDSTRLQQVLWNLLTNAIKFSPEKGRIDVLVQRRGEIGRVVVRDYGLGIEPSFLPHAFDRFRQADASSTRRHGGLGLGLAIVKHMIELHGGKAHAHSDGPGTGATFTVEIPLAANPAPRLPPPTIRPGVRNPLLLDGLRILVVDDQRDASQFVARTLESRGAAVQTADNGPAALQLLRDHDFDVLVCDLAMPEHDGLWLIRSLRAYGRDGARTIPAVAMSAFADEKHRHASLAAGFDRFLPKPLETPALIRAITDLTPMARATM